MKYLKMLGLTAVAAMALTAFLGASSASGTVLCTTTMTEGCAAAGWHIPSGSILEASQVGTGSLETTGGTVLDTCSGAAINQTTKTTGSSTETVTAITEIGDITWKECTKTTDTLEGAHLEIHWIPGTDNGTITIKGGKVTVNSIFGTCTYGFSEPARSLGDLIGDHETPKLVINTLVSKLGGGGLCPAESRWTATFHVTGIIYPGKPTVEHAPLFVSTS